LVIDKGTVDVLTPRWVIDSVDQGEKVPMKKKHFFYASLARQATDDYNLEDEEDENELSPEAGPAKLDDDAVVAVEEKMPKIEEDKIDPALAEWLKIDDEKSAVPILVNDDSATDADSDNVDVAELDEDAVDLDDWFQVKRPDEAAASESSHQAEMDVKVAQMGETEDTMQYDEELIFKHLCFYLDTVDNAVANSLTVKANRHENDIKQNFAEVERLIIKNGGRIGGLEEPKLTHLVIDKRDDSHRLELMKRTAKPKRRRLVVSEFIQACLDEGTLLDEEEFAP